MKQQIPKDNPFRAALPHKERIFQGNDGNWYCVSHGRRFIYNLDNGKLEVDPKAERKRLLAREARKH